jgi:hypothetical protein
LIFHMYTGSDGQSHMENLELPAGDMFQVPLPVGEDINFRRKPMPGWHNAPRRQYVVTLTGSVEMGFGDGTSQRLVPGDVMLAEDCTGQGHTTTEVESPWFSFSVPLGD